MNRNVLVPELSFEGMKSVSRPVHDLTSTALQLSDEERTRLVEGSWEEED
jgi:hypothetical protein